MSLKVYTSSSVSILTKNIAKDIKENLDIFTPKFIVTSNAGINNWLKFTLAKINGIAANLSFEKNDNLINIVYSIISDNKKELLSLSKLQWYIFRVLGSDDFKKKFSKKADYYKNDELKKYALSQKLASLIDKYQMYILKDLDGQDWQLYIWKQVKDYIISDDIITREDIKKNIKEELKNSDKQKMLKNKIPNVILFLNIEFTPYHIDIYKILAEYINITFYFFTPYNESNISNALVDNWGGMMKTTIQLLGNAKIENLPAEEVNKEETLLFKIQKEILQNIFKPASSITKEQLKDNSLIINSCYTPVREVEVLYNYLLKIISESNNSIGARDILVMSTDINTYASSIKGIFDSAEIKLPYSISDTSYEATDSILNAIEAILLLENDYKAEAVIQLLEFTYIKDKYQIEDVDLIRNLISEANIKFGVNGDEDIETNTVSWVHGLKRLIYGFCMSGGAWYNDIEDEYLLLDIVEGADIYELLKFYKFFNDIVEIVEARSEHRDLNTWNDYLNKLINTFTIDEGEQNNDIVYFQKQLSDVVLLSDNLGSEIEYRVFKKFALDIISDNSQKSNFATKGITFCSLNQMRNVPYKIVAILGLNLTDFPRKETKLSYDLTKNNDLIIAQNEADSFLFLQNIVSAKHKLYLSYIGRSVKNNSIIPPSSVIDDLLDYISENYADDKKNIEEFVCEHPLHGFSQKYFDGQDKRYYTYLFDKTEEGKKNHKKKKSDVNELLDIDINSFINFFKNPFKYFYNNILGIFYYENDDLLGESEKFDLNNLDKWSLKHTLLHSEKQLEGIRKDSVENGALPLKNYGEILLRDLEDEINSLKTNFVDIKQDAKEIPKPILLQVGDVTIKGKIPNIYADRYIFTTVSKNNSLAKYFIEFYINCLLLKATTSDNNNIKEYYFLSFEGNYNRLPVVCDITKQQAKEKLEKLMILFKKGQTNILPFILEMDWEKVSKKIKELTNDEIKDKIVKFVNDNYSSHSKELVKEVNNGFFDDEEKIKELKKNTEFILTDLFGIF